jgi:pimeloyl-ACP methyl ester carboxylesterase
MLLECLKNTSLTEATSINLVKSIELVSVATPLTVRSIKTACVRQGSNGTPILLLHGFDSSVLEFRRLFPLLAKERETWAIDLLGFGFTERLVDLTFNPASIKTHLYTFWRQLIDRPVILVGASMGGATAIDFSLTYPEAVDRLVLLDSAGLVAPSKLGKWLFPPLDTLATEFLRNPQIRQNIARAAYYDQSFANEDARVCASLHLAMPDWHRALISFTKSGGYGSFAPFLPHLEPPTLILWGEKDRILGTKPATQFDRAISQSQLIWIPQCGHVPHLEQAELSAKFILEF